MSANGWDVVWPVVYEFPVVFSDSGGTVEKQWGCMTVISLGVS